MLDVQPNDVHRRLRRILGRFWVAPEAHFADARDRSERWLSRARIAALLVFLSVAGLDYDADPNARNALSLIVLTIAALAAVFLHAAVLRGGERARLPFVGAALEIGTVTALMFSHTIGGSPVAGTNDDVLFPALLLAIGANAIRFDPRVSAAAGAAAFLLYAGVIATALANLPTGPAYPGVEIYGAFDLSTQVVRLVVIALAAGVTTASCARVQEIVAVSTRDELTGLVNRKVFEKRLQEATTGRTPFCAAILDIDEFKNLNDSHGHLVGDAALRQLAGMLGRTFRSVDVVARLGGDEFGLLLLGADPGRCVARIRAVHRQIARARVRPAAATTSEEALDPFTVSVGIAVWPDDGTSPAALLSAADRRLYKAKNAGRNGVEAPDFDGPLSIVADDAATAARSA